MSFIRMIRRIFSWVGKGVSALRLIVLNGFFVLSLVLLFLTLRQLQPEPLPEQGVLWLNPTGQIVEQYSFNDPLMTVINPDQIAQETTLSDIVRAIRLAKNDTRIQALVIDPDGISGIGISAINAIHAELALFKTTGKPIYAYSRGLAQHQYLLSSIADQIVLHPQAYVAIYGYGTYREYYKSALDSLLVDVHIFRVGEYKSAMEPYLRDDMSPAAAEANRQWLAGLWDYYAKNVAKNREITVEDVKAYADQLVAGLKAVGGDTAAYAKAAELVDGLGTEIEFGHFLQERIPALTDISKQRINFNQYLASSFTLPSPESQQDTVAIVTVEGAIVDGEAPPGSAGGDSVATLLKRARKASHIKAVVLRVNSPGGSAFASEIIREQVLALKEAGKPVVVSMANMAASGGYWISADADEIWASPTTLTGSIGIFAAVPDVHRAINKLGVHSDGVGTTALSDTFAIGKPINPHFKQALQLAIEHGYEQFIDIVANGRELTREQTLTAAGGRVWTGADALALGLVDQLGELDDAVKSAAYLAGIESEVKVQRMLDPKWEQLGLIQRILNTSKSLVFTHQSALQPLLKLSDTLAPAWLSVPDRKHIYLHCLECASSSTH